MLHPLDMEALASVSVRRRPVYFKELGAFLLAERERRQWQQSEAADYAQRRGLKALTRQVLLRLESGQTKSPDPSALRAIASLYELDYQDLVRRMMVERYGIRRDLLGQARTQGSGHGTQTAGVLTGGSDAAAAQTRVRELEDRIGVYQAILRKIRPRIADVLTLIGEEGHGAAKKKTGGRRRH